MMLKTIQQYLNWAIKQLHHSETAKLDASLLLVHVLQQSSAYLKAWPEKELTETQVVQFRTLVEQRQSGEPIAYILGQQDFWDVTLTVNKDVLIPRPETELLVETAMQYFSEKLPLHCLELGVGSGAITIALAKQWRSSTWLAVDASKQALLVAQQNAAQYQLTNVGFEQSNWFQSLTAQKFNLIISNPPYVTKDEYSELAPDLSFEPKQALVANENGLADLKVIIQQGIDWLDHGGWCMVEHGNKQQDFVTKFFNEAGYQQVECIMDLNKQPRVTIGQKA